MSLLEGRVAIVTGGGRGIGREEAIALASEGAKVVINDLGGDWQGAGSDSQPADEVVDEIHGFGGEAVANFCNVADEQSVKDLIRQAIDTFGDLHILVNNAGILRDGMVFSTDLAEWRRVIDVHVLGHFLTTREASSYFRAESKAGRQVHRAIVNTTSESGLFGNAGQSNYDVAKLGIVGLTMATAKETVKYGVTANAIAPRARTRLTTTTFEGTGRAGEFTEAGMGFDAMDPANIAPFVVFLASDCAADITGQAFIVYGGIIAHVRLPHLSDMIMKEGRWTVDELAARRDELFKEVGPSSYEGPRGYARLPVQ